MCLGVVLLEGFSSEVLRLSSLIVSHIAWQAFLAQKF